MKSYKEDVAKNPSGFVLLADNEDSAHDEQYQKGNLPE